MASRTAVVAMIAPEIWRMDFSAASRGESFSSFMRRLTFSITMIASSTTIPIARMSPNNVTRLMENPSSFMAANVPTILTGIASTGTSAMRHD